VTQLWDRDRGKGRTRRMLRDAVNRMLAGGRVLVVVRDRRVPPIMDMLMHMAPKAERADAREISTGAGSIRLMAVPGSGAQHLWREGQLHGVVPGRDSVLIDHCVIEQELDYALDQWLLWCGPEWEEKP